MKVLCFEKIIKFGDHQDLSLSKLNIGHMLYILYFFTCQRITKYSCCCCLSNALCCILAFDCTILLTRYSHSHNNAVSKCYKNSNIAGMVINFIFLMDNKL